MQSKHNLYENERYDINTLTPVTKSRKVVQWRMRERIKTVNVALCLCLNIGVDPPDVIKTTPCARLECWIDPLSMPAPKALDSIGKNLQLQYERWHPKARYKPCLDPTSEDVKKLCLSLRRSAKDERILFHYTGHGVPRPTNNGEIWVFNKSYTQYIPLSLYELQTWIAAPSIFVFDCSAAGLILHWFNKFADQREQEYERTRRKSATPIPKMSRDFILLGACASNEVLPTNPELPADVFTSCLTTPIKIALKWFCSQTIISGISADLIDKIPGRLNDRRTALGELNWIFTAITDTIAWNVLPQDLFQKLFRQDLLVASLFRNFLLAERIMRSCKCSPLSHPKLPPTYNHPMWLAWDLAADHCLSQLPQLINDSSYEYKHSTFFTEQLTAFEVWLEFGTEEKDPPEQLPIVLQVLLSQQHRIRALDLLGRFLDLGPWAVNQALSVGIFPYVLKLLQSPAVELRKILVFIWAKILALDQSCQLDLVKDNGQHYFVNVLSNPKIPAEQRQQAAFVLSVICNNCRPGQSACLNAKLLQICLNILSNPDPLLRRWVVFCLAKLWENHEEGKRSAIKENAHVHLCNLFTDPVPEVRAAAVYALGTFIGRSGQVTVNREQRTIIELNLGLTFAVVTADSSPLVRKELIIALAALVSAYEDKFKAIERTAMKAEIEKMDKKDAGKSSRKSASVTTASAPPNLAAASTLAAPAPAIATPASSDESKLEENESGNEADNNDNDTDETGKSKGAGVGSAAGGATGGISDFEENGIYQFLWKLIWSLTKDPYYLLAAMMSKVVKRIRDSVAEELGHSSPRRLSKKLENVPGIPGNASQIFGANASASNIPITTGSAPLNSNRRDAQPSANAPTPSKTAKFLAKTFLSSRLKQSPPPPNPAARAPPRMPSQPVLPVINDDARSCLYEWSCQHFAQPLLTSEMKDLTAPPQSERKWRMHRNLEIVRESSVLQNEKISALENEIAILENDNQIVTRLQFHPFENLVFITEEQDGVSIWNWEDGVQVNHFRNGNPPGTRISSLTLLNEHDATLVAIGSDDGVVKIWGSSSPTSGIGTGFIGSSGGGLRLATAWRALNFDSGELVPLVVRGGTGLVVEWQQRNDLLIAAGNVDILKVWDINRELAIQEIPTGSTLPVICMTSDKTKNGTLLVAGCADNSVRLFDRRVNSAKYNMVTVCSEHKGVVVSAFMPTCAEQQIITGATSGEIKFWDVRNTSKSVKTIIGHAQPLLTAFSVHDRVPLLAVGSQDQRIRVMNFNGDEISLIRYHDGFLGQRIGPVSALCFHPYKLMLAAGATDSIVSIYAADPSKKV